MYRVIQFFTDLQDNNYPYEVGDKFPRHGASASDTRISELSGKANKQRKPLIEKVDNVARVEMPALRYGKTEINRMPIADLKALASEVDIPGAEDMSGADIKKALIDHFGL